MHIIVASSNVFHRELSSFILSEAGYTVHEFDDGATLLKCLDQIEPDMVLLDIRLEGYNSVDLARQIRQRSIVPILFLTNGSFSGPAQSLYANGNDYLVWPYQPEDLLAHVQTLLHRSTCTAPASSNLAH